MGGHPDRSQTDVGARWGWEPLLLLKRKEGRKVGEPDINRHIFEGFEVSL